MSDLDTMLLELDGQIRPGDIIFIRIANFLYKRVADGTKSWTSHVGFVHSKKDGEWLVAESAVPKCQLCPLRTFLKRSDGLQYSIKRLRDLTDEEVLALHREADARMGMWYHLGFDFDSPRQYCSKFVYQCYHDALGVEIGRVETLRDLLEANPTYPRTFWRLWYFGFIPWARRVITPASQYEDTQLTTVSEQLGH